MRRVGEMEPHMNARTDAERLQALGRACRQTVQLGKAQAAIIKIDGDALAPPCRRGLEQAFDRNRARQALAPVDPRGVGSLPDMRHRRPPRARPLGAAAELRSLYARSRFAATPCSSRRDDSPESGTATLGSPVKAELGPPRKACIPAGSPLIG